MENYKKIRIAVVLLAIVCSLSFPIKIMGQNQSLEGGQGEGIKYSINRGNNYDYRITEWRGGSRVGEIYSNKPEFINVIDFYRKKNDTMPANKDHFFWVSRSLSDFEQIYKEKQLC